MEYEIGHKQTYLQNRNRLKHREQTCGCQGRGIGVLEEDGVGVWGWQMQTITSRMDKQQGPNVY